MKEIPIHRQLFVDCLDLKISKELSKVWKKLKNTGIMGLRKQLWEKVLEYQANSKISFLNYQSSS